MNIEKERRLETAAARSRQAPKFDLRTEDGPATRPSTAAGIGVLDGPPGGATPGLREQRLCRWRRVGANTGGDLDHRYMTPSSYDPGPLANEILQWLDAQFGEKTPP